MTYKLTTSISEISRYCIKIAYCTYKTQNLGTRKYYPKTFNKSRFSEPLSNTKSVPNMILINHSIMTNRMGLSEYNGVLNSLTV